MSRRSNQKLKLLYLSRILLDGTDERHGMTLTEILSELSQYGIEAGRKSVYDDMEALRVYGYDVGSYRDRYVRYYIKERKIDRAEAKTLGELLAGTDMLPARKRNELVRKIWENGYMAGIPVPAADDGGMGEDAYKNIELACRAMAEGKCLAFKCFEWNERKQRKLCYGGELLTVTPWDVVIKDGRYKIVCFEHKSREIALFSPDKLISITAVTEKREGEREFNEFNTGSTEALNIVLRCDNAIASSVFERFGADSSILSNGDEHFDVSVKCVPDGAFFAWLFSTGGQAIISSPSAVAQKYEEMLSKASGTDIRFEVKK